VTRIMEKKSEYIEYAPGLNTRKSWELYQRAVKIIPGGASSHCRCYPIFDPYPLEFVKGEGVKLWDRDGNQYIDFILAMGPCILGHCHPKMIAAVKEQLDKITMHAVSCETEVKLAEKVHEMVPNADMVRFMNSGAEATMHAIRFARAYTGKDKIVKFEGCYHGTHDYVLITALGAPPLGMENAPYRSPATAGIPEDTLKTVIILPWNNLEVLEKTIKRRANEIAAVITEPVLMNIGTVLPKEGYLKGIQELCEENDIVFILDEVISGFRLAQGGAQEYFGLKPDLATFAKALGAGFPVSAITGKRKIMEQVVPGKILHAGTYNANPVCMAASYAALTELSANGGAIYKHLHKIGAMLQEGLQSAVDKTKAEAIVQGIGPGGCQLYFTKLKKIENYRDFVAGANPPKYMRFHKELLKKGIYFHPQQYEHLFIATVHTEQDVEKCTKAVTEALRIVT
jgi:glutamate-1-semialdehyde 2,1-aminomutase